jgi:hypothetical protein
MFNDERFLQIVPPQYVGLMRDYCNYLQKGWDDFSDNRLSPEVRLKKLELLEKSVCRDCKLPNGLVGRLQKAFVTENLSSCLLTDVFASWRYLTGGKLPDSESVASDVIGNVSSSLARMIMVLYDENPSTYWPMNSLLFLFIWLEMFVTKHPFLKKVKISKRQKESKLNGLLKNSRVLLAVVKSKKLKIKLAVLINTAAVLVEKFKKNRLQKLGILDYIRIFTYSTAMFLWVRRRTVTKEGI